MHSTVTPPRIATLPSSCDQSRPVSYYNQVLPLLTDARVYEQKLAGHRYFVQLVSKGCFPSDDYPVSKFIETVDVVVTEPTLSAIKLLVASCNWLEGYEIVSYHQPSDGSPEF